MILKKSDDAISPVIGVMLMLVMTVVIAAVITVFATGIVTDTEPAPTAILDVKIKSNVQVLDDGMYAGLNGPDFWITHVSGDAVDTRDIEIRVSWTDQDGKYHQSSYSAEKFKEERGIVEIPNSFGVAKRNQPMYAKVKGETIRNEFGSRGLDKYFGDVILTPGLKLTAHADHLYLGATNKRNPCMDVIFDSSGEFLDDATLGIMKYLPEGTAVNVMILHIPSNKAIFDKEVIVE